MTSFFRLWPAALLVLIAPCPAVRAEVPMEKRPEPPKQHAAWTAPKSKLPAAFVESAKRLFELGLADPRGCEYREIELRKGADPKTVKVHGWVLPATGEIHEAVAWNGLVYEVQKLGPKADLRADVREMIAKPFSPARSLLEGQVKLIDGALLLRLGETGWAETMVDQWKWQDHTRAAEPPFASMANAWIWALTDRALSRYQTGDDRNALLDAELLTSARDAIEAEMIRSAAVKPLDPEYHLDLTPLPTLVVECRRRLREGPRTPAPASQTPVVIAEMIRDLDQLKSPADSDSEYPSDGLRAIEFTADPIIRGLVAAGEKAIEPLLRCLAEDERYTRAVTSSGFFKGWPEIVPVHLAAFEALELILDTQSLRGTYWRHREESRLQTPEERRAVSMAIREFWQKRRGMNPAEGWYQSLADDLAPTAEWVEAAEHMAGLRPFPIFGTMGMTRRVVPSGILPGEALRQKHDPSVSELLGQRLFEILARGETDSNTALRQAARMAEVLTLWDGKGQLGQLQAFSRRLELFQPDEDTSLYTALEFLVPLYRARARLGDATAAGQSATWVRKLPDDIVLLYSELALEPLWLWPTDPAIQQAAEYWFGREGSPFRPIFGPKAKPFRRPEIVAAPLLCHPAFRAGVLLALKDQSAFCTIALDPDGTFSMQDEVGDPILIPDDRWRDDPLAAKRKINAVVELPMRTCDLCAFELSRIATAPKARPYWSLADRDRAIVAMIEFLNTHGSQFGFDPAKAGDDGEWPVAKVFPKGP